jgi:nicotinamidase-related amidase
MGMLRAAPASRLQQNVPPRIPGAAPKTGWQCRVIHAKKSPNRKMEVPMEALLVIDLQSGMFADPAWPPHDGEGVIGRVTTLIDAARAAGTPVIFVQHDGGEGDPLSAAGPGFTLHPALSPWPDEPVIVKRFCSAFQGTELADVLAARGITALTICGMQTEFCIDTTCRAAFERGFPVTLIADAHTTVGNGVLSAADIIRHHNATLAGGGFVRVREAGELRFGA